ncbi:MAG: PHP domain-containing protein [[Clostridium] innocuum]
MDIDGEYECTQLIQIAKKAGLRTVALCDHNSMQGIDTMREEGNRHGIHVIAAIEFDSLFHGYETHIIGYGLDYHAPVFQNLQEEINALEFAAFRKKAQRLQELYQVVMPLEYLLHRCETENPFQVIYGTFLQLAQQKDSGAASVFHRWKRQRMRLWTFIGMFVPMEKAFVRSLSGSTDCY